MHTTLDPYNTTEEVELTFNNLNSDWTNGQFKILADEMNLFVRTASKYGSDFMFQIFSQYSQIFSHERNWYKNDMSQKLRNCK